MIRSIPTPAARAIELQAINPGTGQSITNTTTFLETFCTALPCAVPGQQLAIQNGLGPPRRKRPARPAVSTRPIAMASPISRNTMSATTSPSRTFFGYRVLKNLLRYDLDGMVLPVIDFVTPNNWNLSNSQYTEEIQLQGRSLGGNLNWIAGAFGRIPASERHNRSGSGHRHRLLARIGVHPAAARSLQRPRAERAWAGRHHGAHPGGVPAGYL